MNLDRPALIDAIARQHEREAFSGILDPEVTLHHLLTHSAGIPDYFDEAVTDDYEALWRERPMYAFRTPSDFLPLFAHLPMKTAPGTTWAYDNAGYVLLGLAIERASGMPYTEFVERHVLQACGMASSGFFALDRLPGGTARGYLPTDDGGWRTNAYAVPIVGGAEVGPTRTRWWARTPASSSGRASIGRPACCTSCSATTWRLPTR